LRIGASVQTPTLYKLRDEYTSSLNANFGGAQPSTEDAQIDPGNFDYFLTTPMRANGGIAYFVGKNGFLSADVEYVNYGGARLEATDDMDAFSGTNDIIKDSYQSAINLRVGGEFRYNIFRVRAGYAHYGDPYKSSTYDRNKQYITGGVGIKQENRFLDLAVVNSRFNSVYSPYSLLDNAQPVVTTKNVGNSVLFTVGFNF
jgi:hypothetical protein